jgi:regulator of replication initiation timing
MDDIERLSESIETLNASISELKRAINSCLETTKSLDRRVDLLEERPMEE